MLSLSSFLFCSFTSLLERPLGNPDHTHGLFRGHHAVYCLGGLEMIRLGALPRMHAEVQAFAPELGSPPAELCMLSISVVSTNDTPILQASSRCLQRPQISLQASFTLPRVTHLSLLHKLFSIL